MLQDLQPYICTYPKCSDALQMYSSRHQWLEHERLVHRRIWQCYKHANTMFTSSSKLRDHLQSQHSENITENQIQTLLDICESATIEKRTRCPICLSEGPFKRGLDNHMSFHLEAFATFSIPSTLFATGESDSVGDSNSEKTQGHGSDVSTIYTDVDSNGSHDSTHSVGMERDRGDGGSANNDNPMLRHAISIRGNLLVENRQRKSIETYKRPVSQTIGQAREELRPRKPSFFFRRRKDVLFSGYFENRDVVSNT